MKSKARFPCPHAVRLVAAAVLSLVLFAPVLSMDVLAQPELRWWKGNLHTHSLWSDGDDYPEMIVDWYRRNGYHFAVLSDHNVLSQGERWINVARSRGGDAAFERYLRTFGPGWVESRMDGEVRLARLKPLGEFRHLFEEPQQFLLIQSEEITDRFESAPVHLNATNLRDFIPPQGGSSVVEVMQNNVDAVLEQRERTGQAMFPHLNHPNFGWAITAEELMQVKGEKFFEVYNGHPAVHNEGDALHAGTEKMWDIILAFRLTELGLGVIYGLAVDDAHNYHEEGPKRSNPGRGWVMVQSAYLTPEHIVHAMEAGDFYASSGVEIEEIVRGENSLSLRIAPEDGVEYTTQFIGTRAGFNRAHEEVQNEQGRPLRVTRRYSADVGAVLAEVNGLHPSYPFKGDEIYVRATVVSSKAKANPYQQGERERAWIQPVIPGKQ